MRPRGRPLATAALCALFAGSLFAAACLEGGNQIEFNAPEPEPAAPAGSSTTTSTTHEALRTPMTTLPEGPAAPFTGWPAPSAAAARESAIVVKVGNNNDHSRPQAGLAEADIVYEELIEGLKTRFAAVFQSRLPSLVGPVRSARTTDIDLLAGLGTPSLVFSGANTVTLVELREAANRGVFVDAGALRLLDPYFRLDSRSAPYNLWVDMEMIDFPGSGVPGPIVAYGGLPEGTGSQTGGVEIGYEASFGRQVVHLWDPATERWVRVQDGTLHTTLHDDVEVEIAPANVVVLHVVYDVSPADPASPEAQSFSSGPVQVFTAGRVVEGTWSRSPQAPAWDLRSHTGEVVPLQYGPSWFILASADGSKFPKARITVLDRAEAAVRLEAARAAG